MRTTTCLSMVGVIAAACCSFNLGTATAASATLTVHPGQSIQAAIDRARPGGTVHVAPGTYREHLLVTKPLTLIGDGRVVVMPAADQAGNQCTEQIADEVEGPVDIGLCVEGTIEGRDSWGELNVVHAVPDVTVKTIELAGFTEGVLAYGTERLALIDIVTRDTADVGIFAGSSHRTSIRNANTQGSGSSGIRVDLSTDFLVSHSTASGNGWGITLNGVQGGEISHSEASENCVGILAFDTAEPEPTGSFAITHNTVFRNNRFCPSDGSGPSISGLGIALVGTTDVHVDHNDIRGNVPSTEPDVGGAGLLLLDATDLTGGDAAGGTLVEFNSFAGNGPTQVGWYGTGAGNDFRKNRCSDPGSTCW